MNVPAAIAVVIVLGIPALITVYEWGLERGRKRENWLSFIAEGIAAKHKEDTDHALQMLRRQNRWDKWRERRRVRKAKAERPDTFCRVPGCYYLADCPVHAWTMPPTGRPRPIVIEDDGLEIHADWDEGPR